MSFGFKARQINFYTKSSVGNIIKKFKTVLNKQVKILQVDKPKIKNNFYFPNTFLTQAQ